MPSLVCAGDPIFKGTRFQHFAAVLIYTFFLGFGMCRREIIRNGEISPPEPIGPRIKNAAYLKRSNSVCAGIDVCLIFDSCRFTSCVLSFRKRLYYI